jgi:hypothetical protein
VSDTARNRLLVGLAVAVVVLLGLVGFLALGGNEDGGEAASAASSTTSPPSSTSSTSSTEPGTDTSAGPTSAAPGGGGGGGGGIAGPVVPDPDPAPAPVPPPDPPPAPIVLEAEIGGSSACTSRTFTAPITVFWRTRNAASVRLIVDPPSSFVTIDKPVQPIGAEDFGPYFCGTPASPGYAPWSARLIATAADGTVTERVFLGEHRD